jgi:hypothetical protein
MEPFMNFNKIKSRLLKEVGESIIADGFLFNKTTEVFEKSIPGGVALVYFLHNDFGRRIIFIPWWGVRIDRIAVIYNSITEKAPEFFDDTHVLANNLGRLIDYMDNGNRKSKADEKKFVILMEDDVPTIVREIVADIRKYMIPYFEQNNTVQRVNELLNDQPADQSVHYFSYPYKVMIGLVAAKLTNNADYDRLVSIYDSELEEAADHLKREYEKLKVVLAEM